MPSFRSAFPSKYMKAADLNGRSIVATIATVDLETIGTDSKYVARFAEAGAKPVVLNKTNCEAIADIAGTDDVLEWPGHKIEVFPSSTEFQGKRVPCIRVRAPRQARPTRSAAPARRQAGKTELDRDDADNAMAETDADREY